jgi:hypothetical protein
VRRAALFLLLCAPALAQEDDDLARIPSAVDAAPAPAGAVSSDTGKYFAETVFTYADYRNRLAVPFPAETPDWADRTSLDVQNEWHLTDALALTVSDRLNATVGDGVGFPRQAVRNDWREAYLTWEAMPQTFLEAGRINLRNGVAVGFNPTDFFKTRSAVAQVSADPSASRENRLGTFMLRGQYLWDGGSLTFAYAPKLTHPTPLDAGADDGFGPHADYTNAADRMLISVDFSSLKLNPQILVYHEGGRTAFGLDLSYPVGDSVIVYGEWAGSSAQNTVAEAFAYGRRVGTLPQTLPRLPSVSTVRRFQNDVAAGFSWTGEDKESLYLEYHFHQAGMTGGMWRDWFSFGASSQYPALMWYVRDYANAMEQPTARHRIFLRFNRDDLWWTDFSAGVVAFVNPRDGSAMMQGYASYDMNDRWSLSAYAGGNFGGKHTEWGSLSSATSFSFRLARYL